MPREDVPYPSRALCSLKCQIDALNNKINELMKSINGVQGDGQGDLSLVSGDAAIVINNDAAQHEVEISLDQSQLPAAAVSSVNGQTGLVDLDSSDIPMVSGVPTPTVNNKIGAIEGNVTQLQLDLAQEITDRGNADSTLQTNINAANAAITGKVDKLTTAGDHAYTHNGSTQGETAVENGITADTIPIRDANGRMQAADPASGATDKTLVTANWVSQTGPGRPNNVIHDGGNEDMAGNKNIKGVFSNMAYSHNYAMTAVNTGGKYVYLFTVDSNTLRATINMRINVGYSYSNVTMDLRNGLATIGISSYATSGERYLTADAIIACTNDASNKKWDIYMKYPQNRKIAVYVETIAATFALDEYNPANILTGTFTGTLIDDPSGNYLEVVTSTPLVKVV